MPLVSLLLAALLQAAAPAPAPVTAPIVDDVLAEWTTATPGCSVGVEIDGRTVLEKGFGMADLERGVPNRGDTIFEAGSVSKQFTAAAVLLLARDGTLSLDDQVRKYLPELLDYGTPLTIRHMLTHTSGLCDWGSVAGIGGWPRSNSRENRVRVTFSCFGISIIAGLRPSRSYSSGCSRGTRSRAYRGATSRDGATAGDRE